MQAVLMAGYAINLMLQSFPSPPRSFCTNKGPGRYLFLFSRKRGTESDCGVSSN